ncbi:hypothetical protein TL16_g12258 [Triparma laevis f. inornata]|uniref:Phosphatidic acid phosphatase type 2/haloperoxidase domain-containing protein n=2 Tax=Triparma laevis TaxID=1534972 RepID=A0A9W6ZUM5_9STRA|nr:hypothetical protein TrLO_g15257 [Triparma laevis f. longispina]GMH92135.1 hypothetical protein TL16_g12258 [Triparma laevis f. inornata]
MPPSVGPQPSQEGSSLRTRKSSRSAPTSKTSGPSSNSDGVSITKPTPAAFFHSCKYEIDTPLTASVYEGGAWVWGFMRAHLSNQVKFTCDLFKFIPTNPGAAKVAQVCSALGSEEFYCVVIPIMTWCIASYELSRALVLLLCVNLYVGNCCKNLFCLPRPPLKYRFGGSANSESGQGDRKFHVDALGFGWPSTHSCNAVSLPFAVLRTAYGSILHSTLEELTPMAIAGYTLAFLYATAVPFSRLVLGVHSAADVHAGMLYGVINLRLWLSYHQEIGTWMDGASGAFIILASLLMMSVHPRVNPKNYTVEETTCIVFYTAGFLVGANISKSLGLPTLCDEGTGFVVRAARVVVGYAIVLPTKMIIKNLTKFIRSPPCEKNLEVYQFGLGDFGSKVLQYGIGYGAGCTLFAPFVFKQLGLGVI